jgi:type VI secretion system protein ImpG
LDTRLLDYYNRELRYLRELGGEFAREFPKVSQRLGLDSFECADPYVERLLEGFAFLAARVQLKIDADFPRFTEHLLEMLCPNYLSPTPSMAVVQLRPDPTQGALHEGFTVARGTALTSNMRRGEMTACEYRTAQDVTLWPIELAKVVHTGYDGELGEGRFGSGRPTKGSLRIRLRTNNGMPFSALSLDRLPLFVRGGDAVSMRVFEMLACSSLGLIVRDPGAASSPRTVIHADVRAMGLEDAEALLPCGPRTFQGHRLLHEYFAFPDRYLFVELRDLGPAVRQCKGQELEIIVALDRHEPELESAITASHLALYCTPAINLFPKKADRIQLTDRDSEYHVVADRTRPMDFEVFSIVDVTGFGTKGDVRREFAPFYRCHAGTVESEGPAFYTTQRRPRLASSRQRVQGPRSSYLGGEVFLSLVDGREGPYGPDLRQLGVSVLCTNRDLPLRMPVGDGATDFFIESGAPVESVRVVSGPSPPRASHAWGETSWRLISHLTQNYLSLVDADDGRGATVLREVLELYADLSDASVRRQIEGVRSAMARQVIRRLPLDGPASFGRGIEVTLECDETAFEGASAILMGLVLDRFFSGYVSINSFTETVMRSVQRGEIARWPLKIGRRPTI